jgi:hypothetical protein
MGTALLILVEVVGWGVIVIAFAALMESSFARLRRRGRRSTILEEDEGLADG